jgi:hypothetical protein
VRRPSRAGRAVGLTAAVAALAALLVVALGPVLPAPMAAGRPRHRTFYSLAEVNAAIADLMRHLNEVLQSAGSA